MRPRLARLAYALILAWLALFFAYPLLRTIQGGFQDEGGAFTLAFLIEVFRNPIYLEGLRNSFLLAVATTGLVALIAIPLALIQARYRFPGKGVFGALILVPMILPPFVGALGLRQFWGQAGVLNALLAKVGLSPDPPIDWLGASRFWGVTLALALHLYPILYLNAVAALSGIDPAMEEAGRALGAGRWLRFRRITLPLMMPGVFAGGTIVFIWSFTELGTPIMFDYTRVTAVQVFDSLKEIGDNPFPYVLVAVMLASSVILYALGRFFLGRQTGATLTRGFRGASEKTLRGWRAGAALAFLALVTVLALIPHIGLVLLSLSEDWYKTVLPERWTLIHYRDALGHSFTVPSIANSLRYAGVATLIDLLVGLAAAWILARTSLRGRGFLDALVMTPLAVPGIVLAFGYLAMTQPGEPLAFLDPAKDPTLLLIVAYAIRRLPYVVRSVAAGLEQAGRSLEEAARNLGAGPFRTLRRVTLPLISPHLIAGGVLALSFAMLEVSDSLMLAQRQSDFPITKAIYELYMLLGEGRYLASALGVWSMLFLAVGLALAGRLLGRRLGALFRV
ncbi:MAG: hypothetical protein GHCLOJNM_02959 [bacterium]|nr:hypothetical protein [bacterium]